jgi:hypothetical protein
MVFSIPDNPDALLTRQQTALSLQAAGFPIADKTLATRASRGGGPPYQRFGARVLYRWADALSWAESRLSKPVRSTSEFCVNANHRATCATGSNSYQAPQFRERHEATRPVPKSLTK